MIRARAGALSLLAAAALVLTACGTGGDSAKPDATPTPTGPPADLTCETLISPTMVSDLEETGWTSQEDVFRIGELELPDGIQCTWADFTIVDDQLMLFGWAPISAEQAEKAEASLTAEGWLTEEGDEGRYVTENPDTAISVDEDGYGMTYYFGDGWVTVADTKQDLLLIERPEG